MLVADDLSHLGFFLGIELIDFTTTVGLHFSDDSLVHQVSQDLRHIALDGRLGIVNLRHQQGHDIVYRSRKLLLVFFGQVADHEENIDHSLIEVPFLILDLVKGSPGIGQGPLAQMLHGTLEHSPEEPIKGDELSHFHTGRIPGNGEGDIDQ